jgi:ribosomal protein S18 acetylase RimI-like enzyme
MAVHGDQSRLIAGPLLNSIDAVGNVEHVLTALRGLSENDLAAIADLERRVIARDGGRLKLEWGTLRRRSGDRVDDLVWRDGDRVVGFLGFYSFGSADLELAGMVDPVLRRTGIATALLTTAIPIAVERGYSQALLVTPRSTPAGQAFALASHAVLEHSEHFLALGPTPTVGPLNPAVTIRSATAEDVEVVRGILAAGFGEDRSDVDIADSATEWTLVIERDGVSVGTLRITREDSIAGIYGLAVDPQYQGQGIGRDVLNRVCRQLRGEGTERITLEVAVDNDRALDLYLSVGFQPETTEDYYALSM